MCHMQKKLITILTLISLICCISPTYAIKTQKDLSNQTIVFLGDSITGNYQDRNCTNASIPYLVAQMTGATTYNLGFGGAAMTERDGDPYAPFSFVGITHAIANNKFDTLEASLALVPIPIPNGIAHLETLKNINWNKVDTVVIGFGANDYTAGTAIRNPSDPTSPLTLQGALLKGILTLQQKYPHLNFLICSVHPRFNVTSSENGTYTYTERSPNPSGHTLEDCLFHVISLLC